MNGEEIQGEARYLVEAVEGLQVAIHSSKDERADEWQGHAIRAVQALALIAGIEE